MRTSPLTSAPKPPARCTTSLRPSPRAETKQQQEHHTRLPLTRSLPWKLSQRLKLNHNNRGGGEGGRKNKKIKERRTTSPYSDRKAPEQPGFYDPRALLGCSSLPRWDSGNSAEVGQPPRTPAPRRAPSLGRHGPRSSGRRAGPPGHCGPSSRPPAGDPRGFPHGILTPRARREPT